MSSSSHNPRWLPLVDGQLSGIRPVRDGLAAQASVTLLSRFTFTATSGPTALNDTTRFRSFITTGYNVTNKASTAINNLMLVAVNRPTNLGGTVFSAITLTNGSKLTDANLARSVLPAYGMQNSGGIRINPLLASLQVIPSSLAASLTSDGQASGLIAPMHTVLDYVFAVRKVNTSTPGTLAAGETGTMALAFSLPTAANQVKALSLTFAVVTDDTLTFTESLEQQSETQAQLDAALLAQTNRTAAELRTLPGSTTTDTVNGTNYSAAPYPTARTALTASGVARELNLTAGPQGVEFTGSAASVTARGNITLTATVEQNYAPVASVEFKKDAVVAGTANTAPYSASVLLKNSDNGTKNFTAQLNDPALKVQGFGSD